MDGLEIGQFIVVGIYANAEEQTCVSSIHDLVIPKLIHSDLLFIEQSSRTHLHKIGLELLISGRD